MSRLHPRRTRRSALVLAAGLTVLVSLGLAPDRGGASSSHEQINGSGSSWAFNAVNQWITDVTQNGLQVSFTPNGSAAGRQDYANGVTDFAVSDIGYQGKNPITGGIDASNRAYAYLPMVAGGTAFPYHLTVGGQRIVNLRLSSVTLAKIFTNQITSWNDPEITADNNGRALPAIPIIPVIHSEGAGTTYQFTDFLYTQYPSLWHDFSGYSFPVEYWPTGKGSQVAENGSDGVMSFIKSSAGQGSIGYDEYSYALGAGYPVVPIENAAGYFTFPDAYDVAVSLTQAQINYDKSSQNYLLENLAHVYSYNDPRTYPLSSYTYLIEPTSGSDPTMNTAKRQTLADFVSYSICQGQAEMAPIGYSPLPVNLVQASYQQVDLLHSADPGVSVTNANVANCHNPTFVAGQPDNNYLAQIAPQPPLCAKAGQGPCAGQYAHNGNPLNGHATNAPAPRAAGGGPASSGNSGNVAGGATSSAALTSNAAVPSSTGNSVSVDTSDAAAAAAPALVATPTELAADHLPGSALADVIEALVALGLLALIAIPLWMKNRRSDP